MTQPAFSGMFWLEAKITYIFSNILWKLGYFVRDSKKCCACRLSLPGLLTLSFGPPDKTEELKVVSPLYVFSQTTLTQILLKWEAGAEVWAEPIRK